MREIREVVSQLADQLLSKKLKLVTAESCTGGGIACALTSQPGSSVWFDRGFVTYSNEAKQESLGVSADTLQQFGAVSKQVVLEMAEGAISHSHASVAISVSGIAGPDGGSEEKPVGTVWFGFSAEGRTTAVHQCFAGDRQTVRERAVIFALEYLLQLMSPMKVVDI